MEEDDTYVTSMGKHFSYTLSCEYWVAGYRYSRLLFTSEDRLCANLCNDNWQIRRHNASLSRSRDVTHQSGWRHNPQSEKTALDNKGEYTLGNSF